MDTPKMRFIRAADYGHALAKAIPEAKKRIIIHAAGVIWGERTMQFILLLKAAADRGVEVRIVGDAYSKFVASTPHPGRGQETMFRWKKVAALNNELRQAGVQVSYVARLGLNPYRRRTHTKITIVDDTIFTFGGVNFQDDMFSNYDYMLQIQDTLLADRLERLVRDIVKHGAAPMPNLEEQIGGTATLLFDGGNLKQSVIYDTACQIVRQAKKVYYLSQMCPSGPLAKAITATVNECYFIRPKQADPPANLALIVDKARFHITNRYTGKEYIHAKFILTEDKNGSKHIISGSNNFSWRGVAYGTKEIAVHSTDPDLWQQFYNFLQNDIKRPEQPRK